MLLTIVALDYLHDAWFYWTHRLLHWKPLYRHVHAIHHECALAAAAGPAGWSAAAAGPAGRHTCPRLPMPTCAGCTLWQLPCRGVSLP